MVLRECKRNNMCVDCDDAECFHAGQAIADCPFYSCDRSPEHYEECYTCDHMKEMRKIAENRMAIHGN